MTKATKRSVGRPADPAKAEIIIETAWKLFLSRGVEAVALEVVAETAGVAKVTLYKYFQDKDALFEACIRREVEIIEAMQTDEPSGTDLKSCLCKFGAGLMTFIFSDPAVDFYNTLAGELRRRKSLAQIFYATGPGRTRANLASLLAEFKNRGELEFDDAEEAAEHLFGLWQGFSNLQLALGVETKQIRNSVDKRVEQGVEVFLRAYRAK